jgi:hypothetical protein
MEIAMTQSRLSLGQAIDQIISALESLEAGARKTAIEAACAHLKITLSQIASDIVSGQQGSQRIGETSGSGGGLAVNPPSPAAAPLSDIRSLRVEKNPKSAREMACVVAFYLQELAPDAERKESITSTDLERYFKQANFKLPEKITQVLPDAKGAGYFDSPARGAYKLNAVGYNLVAHKLSAKSVAG